MVRMEMHMKYLYAVKVEVVGNETENMKRRKGEWKRKNEKMRATMSSVGYDDNGEKVERTVNQN